MLKVGLVTNNYDCAGGAQASTFDIIESMNHTPYKFMGLAVQNPNGKIHGNLNENHVLSGDFLASLKYLDEVCDVIVVWSDTLGYDFKSKLIFIARGCSQWTKAMYHQYMEKDPILVAVSEMAGKEVFDGKKYHVIHDSINLDKLQNDKYRKNNSYIPKGHKVLGYLGRISGEKGLHDLLEVFKCLPEDWHLSLSYEPSYSEFEQNFEELLEIQIPGRYTTCSPGSVVGDVLRQMDVCGILSPAEGFCRAAAESLAVGTPVLCNSVGFLPEVRDFLPDECYADSQDFEKLANQVQSLYDMKNHSTTFFEVSHEIKRWFSLESHNKKWRLLFEQIEKELL